MAAEPLTVTRPRPSAPQSPPVLTVLEDVLPPEQLYCPGGSVGLTVRLTGRSRQGGRRVSRSQVFTQSNEGGLWDGIWVKLFHQVYAWAKEQATVGDDQLRLTVERVELRGSNERGAPLPLSPDRAQPFAERVEQLLRSNNLVHHEQWRLQQRHDNTANNKPSLP